MDYYIQVIINSQCRKIENLKEPNENIPASYKYIYYRNMVIDLLELNEIEAKDIQEIKYKKLKKKRALYTFKYDNFEKDLKFYKEFFTMLGI